VEENGFLPWGFIHGISPTKDCGCHCSHTCTSKFLKVYIVLFCLKNCCSDYIFIKWDDFFLFSRPEIVIKYVKVKYSYLRIYRKLADPDKIYFIVLKFCYSDAC